MNTPNVPRAVRERTHEFVDLAYHTRTPFPRAMPDSKSKDHRGNPHPWPVIFLSPYRPPSLEFLLTKRKTHTRGNKNLSISGFWTYGDYWDRGDTGTT